MVYGMNKLQKSNLILDPPEEHQIKGRKFTSAKNEIFTKVYIPKDIRPNSVMGKIAYHAVSLAESQLFLGVDITKTENKYVNAEHNFQRLPFYDFMVLLDFEHHDEDWLIQDGLLIRVHRVESEKADNILIYGFIKGIDQRYRLSLIVQCDRWMRKRTQTLFDYSPFEKFTATEMITLALRATHYITCYPKKVRPSIKRDVNGVIIPEELRYTQSTLKLKRPQEDDDKVSERRPTYPIVRKSPIEHQRMGYEATSRKTGRKYWVRPTLVNEGKGGRAEHDYKLGD